jgi:hypothetical protein
MTEHATGSLSRASRAGLPKDAASQHSATSLIFLRLAALTWSQWTVRPA